MYDSEAKLFLSYDPWIRKIHMPSYANTGSYLAGLIAGYLHDRVTNHKLQLSEFSVSSVGSTPAYVL